MYRLLQGLCTGTAYFELIKSASNSDSAAYDMNNFMVWKVFRTTKLLGGKLVLIERKL